MRWRLGLARYAVLKALRSVAALTATIRALLKAVGGRPLQAQRGQPDRTYRPMTSCQTSSFV